MEVFVAIFDYEREREDILSFKKGDKFQIASKADKKWWAAYAIESKDYGYVPSRYLEPYVDPLEGELAQQLADSSFGESKRVALDELKKKIPRTPASASSVSNGHKEPEKEDKEEPVIIKPLKEVSIVPEDCEQIEPKKLPNPHKESKQHVRLNKEIKFNNARGGAQNLGKPELEKVMQRRRPDAEGNLGPIRADRQLKAKSSAGGELEKQLARRTQLLDKAEKGETVEQNKPEFLKVSLRKAQQC